MNAPRTRSPAQQLLLGVYRRAKHAGLLHSRLGAAAFAGAYTIYKQALETPMINGLQRYVRPGTTAIDVGAGLGFFVPFLTRWVGIAGHVLAIEPEPSNVRWLARRFSTWLTDEKVELVGAAAGERSGRRFLVVDPNNPCNHRLGAEGLDVAAVTLDELVLARRRPPVSFVKVDVQGAELRVLLGARVLLRAARPALWIEIDNGALRDQGASAEDVIAFLDAEGYVPHRVTRRAVRSLGRDEAIADCLAVPYCDLLFLTPERGT